jgi:hypothetical protein
VTFRLTVQPTFRALHYHIVRLITAALSNDASLGVLRLFNSNGALLHPPFDPSLEAVQVLLPFVEDELRLTAALSDVSAVASIGEATGPFLVTRVAVGETHLPLIVTAADGTQRETALNVL